MTKKKFLISFIVINILAIIIILPNIVNATQKVRRRNLDRFK